MSRFWQAICGVLVAIVILCMATAPRTYEDPSPFVRHCVYLAVAVSLVALIWAICFRQQVERLRFSLFSLFVLTTMEAIVLCLVRLFGPNSFGF